LLKGVFIDSEQGRLFCTLRLPTSTPRDTVMIVPPFGEEMNKSRRMLTMVAKGLNEAGIAVLNPDLYGTGDSEGAFRDASWTGWGADLRATDRWAAGEGLTVRGLLAVRTGALLAAEFARSRERDLSRTVFWQPVLQGKSFVRQLLRVRAMAAAVGGGARETVENLVARIESGEPIDVAGYEMTAAVTRPLLTLQLETLLSDRLGSLHGIEVTRLQEKCGDHQEVVGSHVVPVTRYLGEPYWSATEIVCDMTIVTKTVSLFAGAEHAVSA
jgi:uncharacterized protein